MEWDMNASNLPLKVKIASPCRARWKDMVGDNRVRYCGQCQKNVYNLSALTAKEATDLLTAKNGNLCARIYQRTDGTVLTEDCPVGMARFWRETKLLLAGGITALFCAAGYAIGEPAPVWEVHKKVISKIETVLGITLPAPRPAVMGKIRASAPRPAPQHLLGEVASSPSSQPASTNAPVQPEKK